MREERLQIYSVVDKSLVFLGNFFFRFFMTVFPISFRADCIPAPSELIFEILFLTYDIILILNFFERAARLRAFGVFEAYFSFLSVLQAAKF